jgi:hypothetical protein
LRQFLAKRGSFHRLGLLVAFVVGGVAFVSVPMVPAEAIVYEGGAPDLQLTSAMVSAGGGVRDFSSVKLFGFLTGSARGAEAAKLTKKFGKHEIADTFAIFDFMVGDFAKIATRSRATLPTPSPALGTGKALALTMYGAGVSGSGKWDVGYMLEHMISHTAHHAIMHDIDAKFGKSKNANFHIVLTQMMADLAKTYGAFPV